IDAEHWANATGNEKARLARARDEKKKRLDELEGQLARAKAELDAIEAEYRSEVTSQTAEPEKELAQEEDSLKKITTDFDRDAKAILEERQKSGEKLGFDPDDLPGRRNWAVPGWTAAAVFSMALLLAAGLGLTRGSLGLAVNVGLAGLALTLVAGGVAAYFA